MGGTHSKTITCSSVSPSTTYVERSLAPESFRCPQERIQPTRHQQQWDGRPPLVAGLTGKREMRKIVLVDDDYATEILVESLEFRGYDARRINSVATALQSIDEIATADLV